MAPPNAKKKMVYSSGKKTSARLDSNNNVEWFKTSLPQYKLKADTKNRFDILPFTAKAGNLTCDEGQQHYELTVHVHKGLGADGRRAVICKSKMRKGNCPICAYVNKHRAEMTDDERRSLSAKHRQIYIVLDRLAEDEASRVKFFETAYKMSFGEMLSNALNAEDEGDPVQHLHSLEEGQTLSVMAKNKTFTSATGGGSFIDPTNIKLEPRKKPLNESILAKYENPEDCLIYLDDKEIKKILESGLGGADSDSPADVDDEEDDDDDTKADADDDEDADDEDDADDDDTDDDDDADSGDDDDDEDDEDDEPKAKSGKKKPAAKAADEDDEDEPEENADDDEEEADEDDDDSGDEDDEDEPKAKGKPKPKQKTAKECGITVGARVKHNELGLCDVTHISGDGTSLKLKDKGGEVHMAQAPEDCTVVKAAGKEAAKPEKKEEKKAEKEKPAKKKVADDDDEW